MHFSLVKRGWRGMFSFGSIARVHPLFLFKYFFYTSKSDDITTFASPLLFSGKFSKKNKIEQVFSFSCLFLFSKGE